MNPVQQNDYEKLKELRNKAHERGLFNHARFLDAELLQYRREHGFLSLVI